MKELTAESIAAYQKRWRIMEGQQLRELQSAPEELRLRQVVAIMQSRHLFPVDSNRDSEIQLLRQRWKALRAAYVD